MEPKLAPAIAAPPAPPAKKDKRCAKCMYPVFPCDIWGRDQPRGTRFQCEICGNRYVVGKKHTPTEGTLLYHLVFRRGITDRSVLSWQYFSRLRKVYVTCICGPLLPIALGDINDEGFVSEGMSGSCVLCDWCRVHFWPFLEGWAEVAKMRKANQRKRARARARAEAACELVKKA